jgi:predicted XRE-type DNA-binding protein
MQKHLAILIVIICTVLLQAHSIPFWVEQTDEFIGYMWSITIEGAALWLWLNKKIALAFFASCIVILVPLMELSKPLMNEIRLVSVNIQISKLNNLEIQHSEKLQDKYIKTDWAGTIKKNTALFRDAINTQKDLLLNGSKLKSAAENIFIMILQGVALIIVLLTQIQALRMLAFQEFQKLEIVSFSNSEISETTETRAEILLKQIEDYMENNNTTQVELSAKLGVSSSTISKLKNRVAGKGEPLSDKKLFDLENGLKKVKY